MAKVEQSVASDTCLRDGSQCERVCGHAPFNTTMTPAVFRNPTEYDVVALAQHYGFSVYSQRCGVRQYRGGTGAVQSSKCAEQSST